MELDNFFLAEYDFQNVDHRTVALEIENADKEHYLGDLEYHIARIEEKTIVKLSIYHNMHGYNMTIPYSTLSAIFIDE